jgi:lysophospholipase L1-like esterase
MDGENVALAVLVAAPALTGYAALRYFRRVRTAGDGGRPGLRRLIVGNALVLVFLLGVVALVGECWLRFVYDGTDSYGLMRTTDRWFERHYKFNAQNVRDDVDYDLGPVPDGKRRVTFIGDSFTAGHGIEDVGDRFANRVRAARPAWQVHVMSANGVDTGRELILLEHNLPRVAEGGYRLDVVVLVYCLNDISDMMPEYDAARRRMSSILKSRGVLARASWLCDALRFLWVTSRDRDLGDYYLSIASAYASSVFDEQRARLHHFHEIVSSRGGRLAVVTFPFMNDIGPGYRFLEAHRRLAAFWREENVPDLDLLSTYEAFDARDLVVGRFDAHPNRKAHVLAAEAIAPFLDRVVGER